jgi:hypothetical protein
MSGLEGLSGNVLLGQSMIGLDLQANINAAFCIIWIGQR